MKKPILHILTAAILFLTISLSTSAAAEGTLGNLATVTTDVGSPGVVDPGKAIFSNRDYAFGDELPAYLIGKPYIKTQLADTVTATVQTDGFVYVLTQVSGVKDSQQAALEAAGFKKIDTVASGILWDAQKYENAVMEKEVKVGDTVTFGKWGILIANIHEAYSKGGLSLTAPKVLVNPTDAEYIDGGMRAILESPLQMGGIHSTNP